jgi:hypothetical protein
MLGVNNCGNCVWLREGVCTHSTRDWINWDVTGMTIKGLGESWREPRRLPRITADEILVDDDDVINEIEQD